MFDRIPTLGINMQNCECGGVPVFDRVEGTYAIFVCGLCREEYRAPAPRNLIK